MDEERSATATVRAAGSYEPYALAWLNIARQQKNCPVRKLSLRTRKPMYHLPVQAIGHDRGLPTGEASSRQHFQGRNADQTGTISTSDKKLNPARIDPVLGVLVGVHCVFCGGSLVQPKILTEESNARYIKRHVPGPAGANAKQSRREASVLFQRAGAAASSASTHILELRAFSAVFWWRSHPCAQASSVRFAGASCQSETACGLKWKQTPRLNACHPSSFALVTLRVIGHPKGLARLGSPARNRRMFYLIRGHVNDADPTRLVEAAARTSPTHDEARDRPVLRHAEVFA